MNTPKPCSHCNNLYVDVMSKNEPNGYVECMAEGPWESKWGDINCPNYISSEEIRKEQ